MKTHALFAAAIAFAVAAPSQALQAAGNGDAATFDSDASMQKERTENRSVETSDFEKFTQNLKTGFENMIDETTETTEDFATVAARETREALEGAMDALMFRPETGALLVRSDTMSALSLIGADIYAKDADTVIGDVHDILFDKRTMRTTGIIVNVEGPMGVNLKKVPVDFSNITPNTDGQTFIVDYTGEELKKAIPYSYDAPEDYPGHALTHTAGLSEMIGAPVTTELGDRKATIKDIVVDRTGQVSWAILSIGGLGPIGDELVAIPVDSMTRLASGTGYTTDFTAAELNALPVFRYRG